MTYPRLAAVIGCALVAFSGCQSNSREETAFQRTENRVIVRQDSEPDRLNPVLTTSGYSRQVFVHIFQYLLI
jgi:ABC-type oligopeptide transport system substrate-binding subunit